MSHELNCRAIDFLTSAVKRAEREGVDSACSWVWFIEMDAADRADFDLFLVRLNDILAWRAGSPESRFRERVRRMFVLDRVARTGSTL